MQEANMMKWIGIVCVVCLIFALCCMGMVLQSKKSSTTNEPPKISVTGEAVVYAKPDKVVITLGIETSDENIALAKKKNTDILGWTISKIKQHGVLDKDIQTDHLSIEPRWEPGPRSYREKFMGYFVRNSMVVTLSEVTKVEQLITSVLETGVNYIHGIRFQTSDLEKYRSKARLLALLSAQEKAEQMAVVLGQSIGNPINIHENDSYERFYSNDGWGWGGGMMGGMSGMGGMARSPEEMEQTIALGELTIKSHVIVDFELIP